jgi:hypothetical protein
MYNTSFAADANKAHQQASNEITEILQCSTSEQNYDYIKDLTMITFQTNQRMDVKALEMKPKSNIPWP